VVVIIAFASSKGGVGKSTACAAVGARLALRNLPQGGHRFWRKAVMQMVIAVSR